MVEALVVTFIQAGLALESAFGAFLITNATALAYSTLVVGSIAVGRAQQRRAESKMREARNRALQDRSVTITSGSEPSGAVYGRAKVGGVLVHAETTGSLGQYLHLVIAHVKHECDAIEAIYFGDKVLPAENPSTGFVETGEFVRRTQKTKTVTKTSNGSGVITFDDTVKLIISATTNQTTASFGYGAALTLITVNANTYGGFTPSTAYRLTYTYDEITSLVRIRKHLGQAGQTADADLIAESVDGWSSTDVGVGVCYTYLRLEYDHNVFGSSGIPQISVRLRGYKVFDPRTSTTYWSDNSQLCSSHYVLNQTFGLKSESSELVYADQIPYANECDEDVPVYNENTCTVVNGSNSVGIANSVWYKTVRPGMIFIGPDSNRYVIAEVQPEGNMFLETNYTGSSGNGFAYSVVQKRYTCNGVIGSDQSVWSNFEAILDSMGGSGVYVQGRWIIRPALHQASVLTINESFLAGESLNIVPHKGRREVFNGVRGQYFDRQQLYTETSYPPIISSTYETQDKGERILTTFDYAMVDNHAQCQRLSKIELNRARQSLLLDMTTNLRGYDLVPGSTVTINLAEYGFVNKLFIVLAREYGFGLQVKYVLQETASALYDWAYNEAEGSDPSPNSSLPSGTEIPTTLTGLTAVSGDSHLNITPSGQVIVRALVSWNVSPDVFVRFGGKIEIEWKPSISGTWIQAGPLSGDETSVYLYDLQATTPIDIRVRGVSGVGKVGDWAYYVHQVVGKTTAPSDVSSISVVKIPGSVRILFGVGVDADHSGTELRRFSSNVWASGVRLDDGVAGSTFLGGRVSQYDWAWPANGTYVIMARHRDTSGNLSTNTASTTVTIVNGDISVSDIGAIGGGNLLKNSSFEVDADGDGIADDWIPFSSGTTGTITYSLTTLAKIHGSKGQRIQASGLGTTAGDYVGIYQDFPLNNIPVGTFFSISQYLFDNNNSNCQTGVGVQFLNAAKDTEISSPRYTAAASSSAMNRHTVSGPVPAGAAHVRYLTYVAARPSTGAVDLIIDAAQLELGSVVSGYSPKASELLVGDVSIANMAVTAISDSVTGITDGDFTYNHSAISFWTFTLGPYARLMHSTTYVFEFYASGSIGSYDHAIGFFDLLIDGDPVPSRTITIQAKRYTKNGNATVTFVVPITYLGTEADIVGVGGGSIGATHQFGVRTGIELRDSSGNLLGGTIDVTIDASSRTQAIELK